jgi:GT2 family glycosyltransferase
MQQCIPSINRQSHPKIEHIIISDGNDISVEAISRRAIHPTRVYSMPRPSHRGGQSHVDVCIDKGFAMASGEYRMLMEDDAWLEPRAIEWLVEALSNNPHLGFSYGATRLYFSKGISRIIGSASEISCMFFHKSLQEHTNFTKHMGPCSDGEVYKDWKAAGAHSTYVRRWLKSMYVDH